MGNQVYANAREVACKAAVGKSTAAFPDVCFLPPDKTPATPLGVPTPLPNTAFASDTTDGSKNVKISGKEIMLKQESYFKKSTGNEASKPTQKKGFVSSTEEGKAYFNSWSMDVKFEGENVVRHLDLTTHNHGSVPGNTPTWPYLDQQTMLSGDPCRRDVARVNFCCTGDPKDDCPPPGVGYKENDCIKAKRCMLSPFAPKHCCENQTPHHLIPKRGFANFTSYNANLAPCVCAEGFTNHRGDSSGFPNEAKTHPDMHDVQDYIERSMMQNLPPGRSIEAAVSYAEARDAAAATHSQVFQEAGCNEECIKKQLDNYHKQSSVGVRNEDLLRTPWNVRRLETIEADSAAARNVEIARTILRSVVEQAKAVSSTALSAS